MMRDLGNQIWCISLHWENSMRLEGRFNWVVWNQGRQCHSSDDGGRLPPRPARDPQSGRLHRHWARRGMSLCSHRRWGSPPEGGRFHGKGFQENVKRGKVYLSVSALCQDIQGLKNITSTRKISGAVTCDPLIPIHHSRYIQLSTQHTVYRRKCTFTWLIWSINRALGPPHACILRAKISGSCRFLRFFFRARNTAVCPLSFSSLVCCSTKSSHAYHTYKHCCISNSLYLCFSLWIVCSIVHTCIDHSRLFFRSDVY